MENLGRKTAYWFPNESRTNEGKRLVYSNSVKDMVNVLDFLQFGGPVCKHPRYRITLRELPPELLPLTTAQNPVAIVLYCPFCEEKDLDDHPGEADYLALVVEAVVVSDGATPGYIVETVPKSVGILVVAGLPEALSRYVHVVVGGPKVPGKGDVLVALPEVGQDLLGLLVVGVGSGSDGLQAGGCVAGAMSRAVGPTVTVSP